MTTPQEPDAILLGGPRDGTPFTAADAAVVTLEIDGQTQRYLRTDQTQDRQGGDLIVFAYDGATTGGTGATEPL